MLTGALIYAKPYGTVGGWVPYSSELPRLPRELVGCYPWSSLCCVKVPHRNAWERISLRTSTSISRVGGCPGWDCDWRDLQPPKLFVEQKSSTFHEHLLGALQVHVMSITGRHSHLLHGGRNGAEVMPELLKAQGSKAGCQPKGYSSELHLFMAPPLLFRWGSTLATQERVPSCSLKGFPGLWALKPNRTGLNTSSDLCEFRQVV